MEITKGTNPHFRTRGNELAKGFYPTFPQDVEMIKKVIKISFGWDQKGVDEKRINIFDPCSGEGTFLNRIVRHAENKEKTYA